MRILITGGFGFIGGRLAVHLAQAGHQIVLSSRSTIKAPSWLPQAEVVQIQWHDSEYLVYTCQGIDVVIHAAGMNAQDCAADPVTALEFNGVATSRLVAAAIRSCVPRFIYLSTAHVYDSPLTGTITENTCPRNLHPYATSHLAGEHAVLGANQRGQIWGSVLRLSNAFGSPVHSNVNCWMLLVNDLCRQAVETHKLVLQTNGLQQRDFISMVDVCRVTEQLAISNDNFLSSGLFNVGTGVSQSVLEMALMIQQRCKQVLGFKPELQRPTDGATEAHPKLHYQTNRFTSIASDTNANITELDNLLSFCHSTFTQTVSLDA
jgi:UDP-glucose 4-epimerase